jgi:LAO/AO transport system kinase
VGADGTMRDLELMIALGGEVTKAGAHSRGHAAGTLDLVSQEVRHGEGAWVPVIQRTVSTRNQGVADLVAALERHRAWTEGTAPGRARRESRLREAMHVQLRDALVDAAVGSLGDALESAVQSVARRELDPYTASERLIGAFRSGAR